MEFIKTATRHPIRTLSSIVAVAAIISFMQHPEKSHTCKTQVDNLAVREGDQSSLEILSLKRDQLFTCYPDSIQQYGDKGADRMKVLVDINNTTQSGTVVVKSMNYGDVLPIDTFVVVNN